MTRSTVQVSNCRVSEMCRRQAGERAAQLEEARNAMCTALDQWEHDIKRSEEQEEKIIKMAQQQVKMLQQTRLSHMEQVMKLRQLCSGIPKRAEEVESQHRKECDKMQAELKTELTGLQKKIMLETQKEELANMQKTLQSAWLM
ncbi:synaptonemal complex protein 3-like [Bacillus rossius redtenbacheri]|uniref:synaptonemal complex protein 3-like n=1 Tax=Bacillus rossius redtenbacheri TaxID=93214 RepID=UPI002FDCDAA1